MFFTAITCTEAFWDAVGGASEASSLALSHEGGKPAGTLLLGSLEDFPDGLLLFALEALDEVLGEALDEAAGVVAALLGAAEVVLEEAPAEDPEAAGCWAAGFEVLEEQPVAVRVTSALPTRSV